MNFIVSEFVNLIRCVPTGWLWKRRYGSGESSYSARLSLRLWKIMMLNWPGSMRGSRKSCGWIGARKSGAGSSRGLEPYAAEYQERI